MKLGPMLTVFRKELTDVLRDRRTLIFMLVIPTVAIPVLMWVTTELMTHFIEKLAREQVDILVLNPEAAPDLVEEIKQSANPLGRAKRVAELLRKKGLEEKELAMTKGEPQAFLRMLQKKGIDPEELAAELRVTAGRLQRSRPTGAGPAGSRAHRQDRRRPRVRRRRQREARLR
jgi:hypothetical protein